VNKDEIVRAVRSERRGTLTLLRELEPERFDTTTALPGWRIREIAAHLITTDRAAVMGKVFPLAFGGSPIDRLEAWNERQVPKWANRPVPELLLALDRWGRRFLAAARSLPAALYRIRVRTPWGRGPAGIAIWVRAYDEWVHRQDIRRALDMPDEEVDVAAAAEFLLTAIGSATLPGLRGRPGRVAISLEGAPVAEWEYDLRSGRAGPRASSRVDAQISAPAPEFIMAAAGRDRFSDLAERSDLTIKGDEELANLLLARIRIV
jgi:uncharacterized protein (TIGR03083 family)